MPTSTDFLEPNRGARIEALADRLLNTALEAAADDVDLAACAAERVMVALLAMMPSNG